MIIMKHLIPAGSKSTISYCLTKHVFSVRLVLPVSTCDSNDVVLVLFYSINRPGRLFNFGPIFTLG